MMKIKTNYTVTLDKYSTKSLRGELCKSGPGYFTSEKNVFPQTLPNKLSLVASN